MSHLQQRGDTIVEVLIAMLVMGLVLTASYTTTNRNYLAMRDAQERTDALKLLERQTETLKAYNVANHAALVAPGMSNFCMTTTGAIGTAQNSGAVGANPCALNTDATKALAGQQPAYVVSISPSFTISVGSGKLFIVSATWDSVLGHGQNKAQIEYGLY